MQVSKNNCWNCSSNIKSFSFFCPICLKIQKPRDIDVFKIFGLPYSFSIDLEKLEVKYYDLQNQLHPDRFINSSEEESYFSQIHSSNINHAFEKIKNSVKRAEELLKVFGFKKNNESQSFNDIEVLNQIMELQDEAENLKSATDKKNFKNKIDNQILVLYKKIQHSFAKKNLQGFYYLQLFPSLLEQYLF